MICDTCKHPRSTHRGNMCVGKLLTGATTSIPCTCTEYVLGEENKVLLELDAIQQSRLKQVP